MLFMWIENEIFHPLLTQESYLLGFLSKSLYFLYAQFCQVQLIYAELCQWRVLLSSRWPFRHMMNHVADTCQHLPSHFVEDHISSPTDIFRTNITSNTLWSLSGLELDCHKVPIEPSKPFSSLLFYRGSGPNCFSDGSAFK